LYNVSPVCETVETSVTALVETVWVRPYAFFYTYFKGRTLGATPLDTLTRRPRKPRPFSDVKAVDLAPI
jgi:hypothetical protein